MKFLFRRRSLSWRLVSWFSLLLLALMLALNVGVSSLISTQALIVRSADTAMEPLIAASLVRRGNQLTVRPSKRLAQVAADYPRFWFVAVDAQGRTATFGVVPERFSALSAYLPRSAVFEVKDRWDPKSTAKAALLKSSAGQVRVLYGGKVDENPILASLIALLGIVYLPVLLVPVLLAFVALPIVVRRSLSGLRQTAALAEAIDLDTPPSHLQASDVPEEIEPLVRAMNRALARIQESARNRQRFLADAAHELRTPIAILQTRIEVLVRGPDRDALIADVARLRAIAEQLLDMQRFTMIQALAPVDLIGLCERVAADLAPAAIAEGYDLELSILAAPAIVMGDLVSIERAVTNLVTNSIQHGGGAGLITIEVSGPATIDVIDQGPGVPPEERQRVFEPFYRLRPRATGAGLGLSLVRQIATLHGGQVAFVPQDGGTRVRLTFGAAG
ncbi:sensor histidine kinase [Caulobacter rhizosphaerae]|uniref:sensor histidine kinase n=1 Tax=Caulobacter rhizosphaerae TaxID=2010972 RepID=UPI0013D78B6D|nr:HAMP domain-containing sensor histidine kinase [Caulobacter rhizosphaerae]GGL35413.1 two-component sensor histidine kinase [Caulobacter rhizosphaerae]